jgi:predicted enzyme related to lactoylglutathione lyase
MSKARVSEIRYVGYATTDVATELAFYKDTWGLEEVPASDGMHYLKTVGHDEHHVVRLRQGTDNRIDVIAFAADSAADVDRLAAQAEAAGARIIHAPRALASPGGGYGFRCFSPEGLPFEVSSDVARGSQREVGRWEALPVRISHIVLHAKDHKAAVRFFEEAFGFRVSDWLGDFMVFLRCNSAHHRLALLPGPPCLNHVAYDMTGVDGMMRGIKRLKGVGRDVVWGPGRHTAGNNTFSYFVSPAGFPVEYTSELEYVDDEQWQATVHTPSPTVMDQWGVGVGGPHTMPHPHPDPGLFQASEV